MRWSSWNEATLREAEERGVPLLLVLVADWCPHSRALVEGIEAHETLANLAEERFVCVRVDKDASPELDARYRGSGWPTALLLHPGGGRLAELPTTSADALAESLAEAAPHGLDAEALRALCTTPPNEADDALTLLCVDRVVEQLLESADPVHGGWGARQKFAHPDALHLLIVRWSQTGDPRTLEVVLRTLRSMQNGAIHDSVEGGFYRFAKGPDWSAPHPEKPLGSNAKRLLAYVEAYQALGDDSFAETAMRVRDWILSTLRDPETGAFFTAQIADAEYANLATREARSARGAPPLDRRIQTDLNAAAIIALLKTGVVLDDPGAREAALGALDFLLEALWDPDEGAAHFWDGAWNQPGFLRDQGALLRALVEAVHYAGENRYLEPAERLAETTVETLGAADGAFRESRYGEPRSPAGREEQDLVENAATAEALLRLGHLTREQRWIESGRRALAAFADDHLRFGFAAAAYGRAVDLLVHPPVHVTVLGPRALDVTAALRKAALRPYVASRLVQSIDPDADPRLWERARIAARPSAGTARAFVGQGGRSYAETSRPERLAALMARTERSN